MSKYDNKLQKFVHVKNVVHINKHFRDVIEGRACFQLRFGNSKNDQIVTWTILKILILSLNNPNFTDVEN